MARAKATRKTPAKTTARKPAANKVAAKKPTPRPVAARPAGDDVIYTDVRREMRSRLLGRLLGA